jgi:hypothetical protein
VLVGIAVVMLPVGVCGPSLATTSQHSRVYSVAGGDVASKQYQPRRTYLTGDGTLEMRRSHWRIWNSHQAVGRGIGYVKNCEPDCGDSTKIWHRRLSIHAYRVRTKCGVRVFTRYREVFERKPPKGIPRRYTDHRDDVACDG